MAEKVDAEKDTYGKKGLGDWEISVNDPKGVI
jgi:hypothetical protein